MDVPFALQLELLQRASLTITHAGLNTTLESLSNGVPMVAIPIAIDQPGVAARIAWTGCGEVVPLKQQAAIMRAGGVKRAADIIEQAVSTGQAVLSRTNG